MWWKHVVEVTVCFAIVYSTVSLFYGMIKLKENERKKRRDGTEDSV